MKQLDERRREYSVPFSFIDYKTKVLTENEWRDDPNDNWTGKYGLSQNSAAMTGCRKWWNMKLQFL